MSAPSFRSPRRDSSSRLPVVLTQVRDLLPDHVAEGELAWFFGESEAPSGLCSNFSVMAQIKRTGVPGLLLERPPAELDAAEDAAVAAAVIRERLDSLPEPYVGVLSAAFEPIAWPTAVRGAFGKLSGVAVRIWAGRHRERLARGHEHKAGIWLEARLAVEGPTLVEPLHRDADAVYGVAFGAYLRARGDGPSVVPEEES